MNSGCEKVNIDYSIADKLKFDCVRGCGLCCAFRPQIGGFEMESIKRDPELAGNYTEEADESGDTEYYLRLKSEEGNPGACVFLKKDRLCGIYGKRPFKCRMFPFYLRFGDSVQVDADLACPGLWVTAGKNAGTLAMESVDGEIKKIPQEIYEKASRTYADTRNRLRDTGLLVEPGDCRKKLGEALPDLCDVRGLESAFEMGTGSQFSAVSIIDELGSQLVENAFSGKTRPVDYPLFLDDNLNWEFFTQRGGDIVVNAFDGTGAVRETGKVPFEHRRLAQLSPETRELLLWYLGILNMRQSTYDFALLSSSENMAQSVLESYFHAVTLFTLETWSMAQLYSHVKGVPLDAKAMRKGIQAVDNGRVTGPAFDVI
jgi:Fe-S-cluster containining protein